MAKKISAWAMVLRAFLLTLFTGSQLSQTQAQGNPDNQAWTYAASIGTAAAMREYLRMYPNGAHIEEAIRVLIASGEIGPGTTPYVRPVEQLSAPPNLVPPIVAETPY
ncbi:hypothetical protein LGT41_0004305 [Abyssibius alkaniclasticus]|uniref:hypothetical protein n=1 Tax=Abyssibius alkaniclasticus TaxID=2881234 RepID=UPI002363305F|nr:hypothetical protein [Abyssibius alkaniclasticus]UPH72050.1 hypothetical protein LGT41_0004305 [Abyssibius alkaniclasticus]